MKNTSYLGRVIKSDKKEYSSISPYWIINQVLDDNKFKIAPLFIKNQEDYIKTVDLDFVLSNDKIYTVEQSNRIYSDSFAFSSPFRLEDVPFIYGIMLSGISLTTLLFLIDKHNQASYFNIYLDIATCIALILPFVGIGFILIKNKKRKSYLKDIYKINASN